jgi:hypothetical protein
LTLRRDRRCSAIGGHPSAPPLPRLCRPLAAGARAYAPRRAEVEQRRLRSQCYQRCRQSQNCHCDKYHSVGGHACKKLSHLLVSDQRQKNLDNREKLQRVIRGSACSKCHTMAQTTEVTALALVQPLHGFTLRATPPRIHAPHNRYRTIRYGRNSAGYYGLVGVGGATAVLAVSDRPPSGRWLCCALLLSRSSGPYVAHSRPCLQHNFQRDMHPRKCPRHAGKQEPTRTRYGPMTCVRSLCQRPATQMPHCHRRVHQGRTSH